MTLVRVAAAAVALALASSALAGPLFTDPYGVGAPDVIGNTADFDIRSLEVLTLDTTTLSISVRMNYHGGDSTLAPFLIPGSSYPTVPVGPGDILIQGATSLWALPLSGGSGGPGGPYYYAAGAPVPTGTPAERETPFAGSLYRVTGVMTAGEVLGADPAADLRADQVVFGYIYTYPDLTPTFIGNFPNVIPLGGPELDIRLLVYVGPEFYDDVAGGYSIHFASSTCACDVLDATYPAPVPEPSSAALVAGAGSWLWLRRRTRLT